MLLVDALKSFNRKERYWLIRNALGEVKLDEKFCERLGAATGVTIPFDAYWVIDYHFDWLAGAIALLANVKFPQDNEHLERSPLEKKLVEGNQEDCDLLIAFERTIILVECKAGMSWNKKQRESKCARKSLLEDFIKSASETATVDIIFCEMSVKGSSSCEPSKNKWIKLDHFADRHFHRVERCDAEGKPSKDGDKWRVTSPTP